MSSALIVPALLALLQTSTPSHALGTPDQDPYVAWARSSYASARTPTPDELLAGKTWNCTMAFSIRDLFHYEAVPTFQFKIEGDRAKNTLLLDAQREFAARRYDFRYGRTRDGKSNLARDIDLAWYVSVGSNWANPETATPFKMHDAIRVGPGGRLIVQRSVRGKDKERLSRTYRAHQEALGREARDYDMPDAIPDFGREVEADLNKRQYAFQYFVCDRPGGSLPLIGGEENPPRAARPQHGPGQAGLGPRDFIDTDGTAKRCPEGSKPVRNRIVEWFTETTPTATSSTGEDWLRSVNHLVAGREGQAIEFTSDKAQSYNLLDTVRDSDGRRFTVEANRPYIVKSFLDHYRCVRE